MKETTRQALEPFVNAVRGYGVLDEVRPLAFHLDGRDFLHFHELRDCVVADVWLSRGRVRMPVNTADEQAELLERIEHTLDSLSDRPGRDGARRRERRRR